MVAEVTRPELVMVETLPFAKAQARPPGKATLPDPMAILDSVLDEYYRARRVWRRTSPPFLTARRATWPRRGRT